MSSLERIGLLAFSAGVSALIVALVLPYTDPESLAVLTNHPLGARALNISTAALNGLARLLDGVSSSAGPSLRQYHPLARNNVSANTIGGAAELLDWSDPEVWRLQQQEITHPLYTESEVARLLHWCDGGGVNGSTGDGGEGTAASAGPADAARFARLVGWISASGGDASKVKLGTDRNGVRGLHAARAIATGEVALSVPLKVGLSAATFRAARVLAGPTAAWRKVEDADLFLDALALSYEVAAHGERSPWADYLCLLPRSYGGLPMHISDPWVASLLSELPSLRRLAAKRRAQLALFGNDLVRPAVTILPGGRAAMARLLSGGPAAPSGRSDSGSGGGGGDKAGGAAPDRDAWQVLWHWAYAAAKTRGVALSADELQRGGAAAPVGEDLPVRLPTAMLDWVQELGVMLPILDMANHAFEGRGTNVAYQLIEDSTGTGLAAALVAQEPIAAGQPLLFDYVGSAEADTGSACLDRWLIEYGFVPDEGGAQRDCDTFDVTAKDIAHAVLRAATAAAPSAEPSGRPIEEPAALLEQQIRESLSHRAQDGLPSRLEVHVRQPYTGPEVGPDHVAQRWGVLQWLKAALRHVPAAGDGGGAGGGAGGKAVATGITRPDAGNVLRALLRDRLERLQWLEQQARDGRPGSPAREAECAAEGGGGGRWGECSAPGGDGTSGELRAGLAAVAAAGRRAVQRALDQELAR